MRGTDCPHKFVYRLYYRSSTIQFNVISYLKKYAPTGDGNCLLQNSDSKQIINIISRAGVQYKVKCINGINVNLGSKMCLPHTLLDQDMQAIFKYVIQVQKIILNHIKQRNSTHKKPHTRYPSVPIYPTDHSFILLRVLGEHKSGENSL